MLTTLDDLRRFAVHRSLFAPTTLKRALRKLGYVQADPIRAPARAQDLMLRHRVKNYRAGDLERHYAKLDVEEDFFVAYGFVTRSVQSLMHPRDETWPAARRKRAALLLEFVHKRGEVHPREVDDHFAHGLVKNYWGGSSNATTMLLDAMHYRGMLRIVRRESGVRIYAPHNRPETAGTVDDPRGIDDRIEDRIDALVDIAVRVYAPLPAMSLGSLVSRLRYAVPQWRGDLRNALRRAKQRLAHSQVNGTEWYWPAEEYPGGAFTSDTVRLLAPFDPVVWDRRRFEMLWDWAYRFEAYTPAVKRKLGYYALPMLWGDRVIGWANISAKNGSLETEFGYVKSAPRDRMFKRELRTEMDRMGAFLGLGD